MATMCAFNPVTLASARPLRESATCSPKLARHVAQLLSVGCVQPNAAPILREFREFRRTFGRIGSGSRLANVLCVPREPTTQLDVRGPGHQALRAPRERRAADF